MRNEDPKDAKLREYQAEIERLRSLIEQRRKRPPKPARPRPAATPSPDDAPGNVPEFGRVLSSVTECGRVSPNVTECN